MSKGTDYTGSTGRFGPRYGVRIRRRIRDIEEDQRDDHLCPGCGHEDVSREAAGVWQCEKCGHKFAGGAYRPETASFRASQRQLEEALADEEGDVDDDAPGGQVLDESETVAPGAGPGAGPSAGEAEPEAPDEPEEPPEADETPEAAEGEDELDLEDDVPEVDVPELEDIPEVEGPEDAPDEPEEAPEAAEGEDDDVVPEADLDVDRDDEEEA